MLCLIPILGKNSPRQFCLGFADSLLCLLDFRVLDCEEKLCFKWFGRQGNGYQQSPAALYLFPNRSLGKARDTAAASVSAPDRECKRARYGSIAGQLVTRLSISLPLAATDVDSLTSRLKLAYLGRELMGGSVGRSPC